MYENSITGGTRALDLLSRIGAEERVGQSLSADTIVLYSRKIRQAASRVAGGEISRLTPEMLVRDLSDRVDNSQITRATARLEKASALFWIASEAQSLMDSGDLVIDRYESAYRDIQFLGTSGLPKKSGMTSSPNLKAFPDEAVDILSKAAIDDRNLNLLHGLLFIRANLVVGLRPIEWLNAALIKHQKTDPLGEFVIGKDGEIETCIALRVYNAKQSVERANGEHRIIMLEGLTDQNLSYIRKWLAAIKELYTPEIAGLSYGDKTKRIYDSLQRAIRRTLLSKGWEGSVPSIYGTRHQAVANAKADGQDRRQIAALFGHASEETAHRHYARKFSGYTGRSMRAARESLLAVRYTQVKAPQDAAQWSEPSPRPGPRPDKS